jgi:peptidoglycan/xylan/chitin deacetylase (PgdA/CDA1 family)
MTAGIGGPARTSRPPGRIAPLPPRLLLAAAGVLILIGLAVAWIGQGAVAAASATPGVAWVLRPASNTVTIRLTPGGGPDGRQVLARSRLIVSGAGTGRLTRKSPGAGQVRVPVPPGRRTQLLVQVTGPRPVRRTLTVTVPPALRITSSRPVASGWLVSVSSPVRQRPHQVLCGRDKITFPAANQVAVVKSTDACRARLTVTARNGEQATVPVSLPGLPQVPLYAFARPAGRAIYITVDDGWTPSPRVLDIMRRTHLPVTAFLIAQAAQRDLPYWRAFVHDGGTIGDHTVSHPNLTKQTLSQATAQWDQARRDLGRWLGRTPDMGRPPYGAFDHNVEAAAYRGGLQVLVGWSASVAHGRIATWDDKPLEPGEIVLLHWVPGLGQQLTRLLAVIHARHLHPMPLTPASFAGTVPQQHSLGGGD